MKEYEKLAISYSCNFSQFGPLDPITEAYEEGFLKAREMVLNMGVDTNDDDTRVYVLSELEKLGEKEV